MMPLIRAILNGKNWETQNIDVNARLNEAKRYMPVLMKNSSLHMTYACDFGHKKEAVVNIRQKLAL